MSKLWPFSSQNWDERTPLLLLVLILHRYCWVGPRMDCRSVGLGRSTCRKTMSVTNSCEKVFISTKALWLPAQPSPWSFLQIEAHYPSVYLRKNETSLVLNKWWRERAFPAHLMCCKQLPLKGRNGWNWWIQVVYAGQVKQIHRRMMSTKKGT